MSPSQLEGRCHCGNVAFRVSGPQLPLAARSCMCSFCHPRGASWVSDPGSTLEVVVRSPAQICRYTFATQTAEFHVCSRCGAVPLATSRIDGQLYAVLNVKMLLGVALGMIHTRDADVASETLPERLSRRQRSWIGDVRFAAHDRRVPAQSPRSFRTSRTILFGDCDPGGIVYTPRVADFVAEAVLAFMSDRLGTPAARYAMQSSIRPPARLLSIEYLSPMVYDDQLEIEVAVEYIGTSSIEYAVCARRPDQTPTFRARLVQVCVSAQSMRPVAVPDDLREKLGCELT